MKDWKALIERIEDVSSLELPNTFCRFANAFSSVYAMRFWVAENEPCFPPLEGTNPAPFVNERI